MSFSGSRFLQHHAVKPKTRQRYRQAVLAFMRWRYPSSSARSSPRLDDLDLSTLDHHVSDYIHYLYFTGEAQYRAVATVYGLEFLNGHVKGHLRLSKVALRGWRNVEPGRVHPPLTWDMAVLVALQLRRCGELAASVAVLLMFDCYLRVGEMADLRARDVVDASSARMGSAYGGMALFLRRTKTGRNQSVEVRRPIVRELVSELVRGMPPSAKVFGATADHFRRRFRAACASLGLDGDYVPHSLRHGGATCDFLSGVPMIDVINRGRWAVLKTAQRYVQAGRALLAARDVPPVVARLGAFLSSDDAIIRRVFKLTATARPNPSRGRSQR